MYSYGNSSLRAGVEALAGSNGVGDLSRELAFAQDHAGISGLALVPGTEPFSPLLWPRPAAPSGRPVVGRPSGCLG